LVKLWLAAAEEDLAVADVVLKARMSSYKAVSFHSQQAAEKALKGLLVRHQIEFGKTHNLGQLLRLAEPVAPGILERLGEARGLTRYAVGARYPGEERGVAQDEARRHLGIAGRVLECVDELLKPYLDAGRPSG
jgi:HEPN domain-containing protein